MQEELLEECSKKIVDNYFDIARSYSEFLQNYVEENKGSEAINSYEKMMNIWADIATHALKNPEKLYNKQIEYVTDYLKLFNDAVTAYSNHEELDLDNSTKDKRFTAYQPFGCELGHKKIYRERLP